MIQSEIRIIPPMTVTSTVSAVKPCGDWPRTRRANTAYSENSPASDEDESAERADQSQRRRREREGPVERQGDERAEGILALSGGPGIPLDHLAGLAEADPAAQTPQVALAFGQRADRIHRAA